MYYSGFPAELNWGRQSRKCTISGNFISAWESSFRFCKCRELVAPFEGTQPYEHEALECLDSSGDLECIDHVLRWSRAVVSSECLPQSHCSEPSDNLQFLEDLYSSGGSEFAKLEDQCVGMVFSDTFECLLSFGWLRTSWSTLREAGLLPGFVTIIPAKIV